MLRINLGMLLLMLGILPLLATTPGTAAAPPPAPAIPHLSRGWYAVLGRVLSVQSRRNGAWGPSYAYKVRVLFATTNADVRPSRAIVIKGRRPPQRTPGEAVPAMKSGTFFIWTSCAVPVPHFSTRTERAEVGCRSGCTDHPRWPAPTLRGSKLRWRCTKDLLARRIAESHVPRLRSSGRVRIIFSGRWGRGRSQKVEPVMTCGACSMTWKDLTHLDFRLSFRQSLPDGRCG